MRRRDPLPPSVRCQCGVTDEGELYLAMEYCFDVGRWLVEHGPLTEHQALGVMQKIAAALAYALEHGIIHRDVSPRTSSSSGNRTPRRAPRPRSSSSRRGRP